MINVRNLAWLRSAKTTDPEYPARLHEALRDMQGAISVIEQQTNSSVDTPQAAPPALQSMNVTPTQVGHHISITHQGEYYRGITYHIESADNPHFTNPFPQYTGPAREIDLATGSQALYFQAFASYNNGPNTNVVFHGGTNNPQPVIGGTASPRGVSQGSGTGKAGQGRSGFGPVGFLGNKPPVRGLS